MATICQKVRWSVSTTSLGSLKVLVHAVRHEIRFHFGFEASVLAVVLLAGFLVTEIPGKWSTSWRGGAGLAVESSHGVHAVVVQAAAPATPTVVRFSFFEKRVGQVLAMSSSARWCSRRQRWRFGRI